MADKLPIPFLPKKTSLPWQAPEGVDSTMSMLRNDLGKFDIYPYCAAPAAAAKPVIGPVRPSLPATKPLPVSGGKQTSPYIGAVQEARDFALGSPANVAVPEAKPAEEKSTMSYGDLSKSYSDVGVSAASQRGVREYVKSGYTRTNPNGTTEIDKSWAGKWKSASLDVAKKTWWEAPDNQSYYSFKTHDQPGDLTSGTVDIAQFSGSATSKFAVSKKGVNITPLSAKASAALVAGKVGTAKDGLLKGEASGALMKAEGEASAAFIANPEEVTLSGKLGASANLAEGSLTGEVCVTPMRVLNAASGLYKWMFDKNLDRLGDNWDIGICAGGEVQAAAGAQAEANAEASYKKGKARLEAGAKLGLGLGGGVKASASLVGVDKAARGVANVFK